MKSLWKSLKRAFHRPDEAETTLKSDTEIDIKDRLEQLIDICIKQAEEYYVLMGCDRRGTPHSTTVEILGHEPNVFAPPTLGLSWEFGDLSPSDYEAMHECVVEELRERFGVNDPRSASSTLLKLLHEEGRQKAESRIRG